MRETVCLPDCLTFCMPVCPSVCLSVGQSGSLRPFTNSRSLRELYAVLCPDRVGSKTSVALLLMRNRRSGVTAPSPRRTSNLLFCARRRVVVTRYPSRRLKRDLDGSFSGRVRENSSDLKPQPGPRRRPPATTATPQFDPVQLIPVLCLAAASDERPRGGWKSLPERVPLPGKCGGGP